MNVPRDRNPCLTVVSVEKKRASTFIKKGDVLKSTQKVAIEAIRSRPSPHVHVTTNRHRVVKSLGCLRTFFFLPRAHAQGVKQSVLSNLVCRLSVCLSSSSPQKSPDLEI